MAIKPFPTLPGTIEIPDDLNAFKGKDQVVWTASNWRKAPPITITHGPSATQVWGSTEDFGIERAENVYQPNKASGFMVYANAAVVKTTIFEMYGNSRWMPASVFYGIGFETFHQHMSGPQNHRVYLSDYALCFQHRTSTEKRYYGWSTGYSNSPGHNTYRFDRIRSGASDINTIRRWGPDWLYQGMVVACRTANTGGGSDESFITIYNMKVGSKFTTVGGAYRYLPLKNRGEVNRDGTKNNKGFSNPFEV